MAGDLQALLQALAAGKLAPVYLVAGDEPLQLQEAADAIRASARTSGCSEREVFDVDAHFDWNRLARSGASLSLFAQRRLIEVRLPSGRADRDGGAAIAAWCDAPAADTVLLISAMQWSKKHEAAWVKSVERVGEYLWLRAPRTEQLPAWIRSRMQARGFAPGADAVALLASRAEGNLLVIAQEIDKLAALRAGGPVSAADLEAIGADNAIYDVFRLTDAAFGGDAARVVKVLDGLRAEGEELIPMLGWIITQLDLAYRLAGAPDFATGARNEYGLWPERQKLFAGALQRAGHGDAHWRRSLACCARIDRVAKGREFGEPWRELERLLVAIALPRAAATLWAA